MKTQIKGLINGYDPKMFAFPRDKREGSSVLERERVWNKVFAENGMRLHIEIRGRKFELSLKATKAGRTAWYEKDLTKDEASFLLGTDDENKLKYNYKLVITMLCIVYLMPDKEKRGRIYLEEESVTIL